MGLVSDDNGNLIEDGNQKYEYDGENRLIRVRRASDDAILQEYKYDPLSRRVKTIDHTPGVLPEYPSGKTITHVYAGGAECLAEYDSTAAEGQVRERWFVHGAPPSRRGAGGIGFPDPLVMVDVSSTGFQPVGEEEYLYYFKDMLGSVTALANSNGDVVERYVYDPYGKTTVTYSDGAVQLPPLAKSYYHDSDLDGDVDEDDQQHLEDCANSSPWEPMCVFVHDRNGNNEVDSQDMGMFAMCDGNPQQACSLRPPAAFFDANGDNELEGFDWLAFHACFGAIYEPNAGLCKSIFDISGDDEVNLDDYAEFQRTYGGPGVPRTAGSATPGASSFGNPFAWTGQRHDAAIGLYNFKYRSYSPTFGRWLQRDPIGYMRSSTLYEYTVSQPTTSTDPFGLDRWVIRENLNGGLVVGPIDGTYYFVELVGEGNNQYDTGWPKAVGAIRNAAQFIAFLGSLQGVVSVTVWPGKPPGEPGVVSAEEVDRLLLGRVVDDSGFWNFFIWNCWYFTYYYLYWMPELYRPPPHPRLDWKKIFFPKVPPEIWDPNPDGVDDLRPPENERTC